MSRQIDLSKYETVKQRKKRFYDSYPDGRIVVHLLNEDKVMEYALVRVSCYRNGEDQKNLLPMATGYAQETRDMDLKKAKSGKEYESVNYTSWLENCEESAIGRCLDNAGFASNMLASREEMAKSFGAKRRRQIAEIRVRFSKLNEKERELLLDGIDFPIQEIHIQDDAKIDALYERIGGKDA